MNNRITLRINHTDKASYVFEVTFWLEAWTPCIHLFVWRAFDLPKTPHLMHHTISHERFPKLFTKLLTHCWYTVTCSRNISYKVSSASKLYRETVTKLQLYLFQWLETSCLSSGESQTYAAILTLSFYTLCVAGGWYGGHLICVILYNWIPD